MTARKSLTLGILVLFSAILLVSVWVNYVGLGPYAADSAAPTGLYERAAVPVSLGLVLLFQFLFAWVARAPVSEPLVSSNPGTSRDAWKRVWIRLFVSFCWTLILAILLFVILAIFSGV